EGGVLDRDGVAAGPEPAVTAGGRCRLVGDAVRLAGGEPALLEPDDRGDTGLGPEHAADDRGLVRPAVLVPAVRGRGLTLGRSPGRTHRPGLVPVAGLLVPRLL